MGRYLGYQGYGRRVFFRNKEYYIWHSEYRNSYFLCVNEEDIGIKSDIYLMIKELEEVIDIINYRDGKLDLILN